MAKSRVEKNKKLYEALDEEMKNNKENMYEEKLKAIDPNLENNVENDNNSIVEEKSVKKSETKTMSALSVIAKEVNGKNVKKNDIVVVKENKKESKKVKEIEMNEEYFEDPISFTDKLSVEEILRAKLEQQQKIRSDKKNIKKGPNDASYTPEMMQERIKQHEGINIRKEAKIQTKNYRKLALALLTVALIAVIAIGVLLVLKVIKI